MWLNKDRLRTSREVSPGGFFDAEESPGSDMSATKKNKISCHHLHNYKVGIFKLYKIVLWEMNK